MDVSTDKAFTPKRKILKLVFEVEELAGLVVRCRSMPVGDFLALAGLASTTGAGQMDAVQKLFTAFGGVLVDWNVHDENGKPVPATTEGLMSQDLGLGMQIIREWVSAAAGVDAPLGPVSPAGEQSVALSIPMETSSTSPQS